jgi:hypothetical protein
LGWAAALKESPKQKKLARRMAGYAYRTICQLPDRIAEYA